MNEDQISINYMQKNSLMAIIAWLVLGLSNHYAEKMAEIPSILKTSSSDVKMRMFHSLGNIEYEFDQYSYLRKTRQLKNVDEVVDIC